MADDDEDKWLYGDSSEDADSKKDDKVPVTNAAEEIKSDGADTSVEDTKATEEKAPALTSPTNKKAPEESPADIADVALNSTSGTTGGEEDSDEDSDDEDDVQITIGDIKSGPPTFTSYGAIRSTYRKSNIAPSSTAVTAVPPVTLPPKPDKTLDLDAEGTINGVGVYSFELETVSEKPWYKPGADITDYFNYGFSEETWKLYSDKQRKLRIENKMENKIMVHHAGLKDKIVPPGTESTQKSSAQMSWAEKNMKPFQKKPFQHKPFHQQKTQQPGPGPIRVIGSSISTISRRRDSDDGNPFITDISSTVGQPLIQQPPTIRVSQPQPPPMVSTHSAPVTIQVMHSGPPPSALPGPLPGPMPVMPPMNRPMTNMVHPPPGFNPPQMQQAPAPFHNVLPPAQRPFMPPMNNPQLLNRPPPNFNAGMPPPMRAMMGPPPGRMPPPVSLPAGMPPVVRGGPPRMQGPRQSIQGDSWNRPPFYPNANAPRFAPSAPPNSMQGSRPRPGHGPPPSPGQGGSGGGSSWERPVSGFPSFQDQWSPRAPSEESDISSGSEDFKRSPRSGTPTRGTSGGDERRDYRSSRDRDKDRDRERERRGRYAKESSTSRDSRERSRHQDRSQVKDRGDKERGDKDSRDHKSRDREERHKKRKEREEERSSDGHRSSRHKRSKHSHRDSEKEERSGSHGHDEMGKDLVIADEV